MHSCSLCLKYRCFILSHMNEVDSFISAACYFRCVFLYEIQNCVFQQKLERIKNEPYFRWSGKMDGDLASRNQSLYCTYHKEKGHTTEQCRVLKDHLEQLIKAGHLKEFVID